MELIGKIIGEKYHIIKKLNRTIRYNSYVADNINDPSQKFIIKILNNQNFSTQFEDIVRFQNDLNILTHIHDPSIEQLFEFVETDGTYILVSEYWESDPLEVLLKGGQDFTIEQCVDIIMKIVSGLQVIQENLIIHRELNCETVFVMEKDDSYDVKIADLSLARIMDYSSLSESDELLNIFSYKSPEDCGVINRNVENSSDLYSLGIIFYYLLTRKMPFSGKTVSAILHQHIALVPGPPSLLNPVIPEILDQIVLRLLEKDPERRYQSASGLIKDLKRFSTGSTDFVPGMDDQILHLNYKTKLIGREEELETLKDLYHQAMRCNGNMIFIAGESGRGKSRLVEDFLRFAYSKDTLSLQAKCFAGENKTPYAPFKEILKKYRVHFKKYLPSEQDNIRDVIRRHIGELGDVILTLQPDLKDIIGEYPPVIKLDEEKEIRRFLMVASRLLCALAEVEKGMVLWIDDLQWADEGTIGLLEELLGDIPDETLFVIGAFRDDEVSVSHPISGLLNNVKKYKSVLNLLKIDLFNYEKMYAFISQILYRHNVSNNDIVELIYIKSKGNPFFAIEILKQLISEKALYRFDEQWVINPGILESVEISSAVLEVVIKRISLLSDIEKDILSTAAVIGREFDFPLLFELCKYSNEIIVRVVDKAVSLQIMEISTYNNKKILFVHDRLRDAFYEILSPGRRKEIHNRIGVTLERMGKSINQELLFELAYHYINGENDEKIMEYAYPAGDAAKTNFAHDQAARYFEKILEVIDRRGLTGSYLWLSAVQKLADVCLTTGKTDYGINLFNKVLPFLKDKIEIAAVYRHIAIAYYNKGEYKQCEEYSRIGLELLGEKLPINSFSVTVNIIKELVIHISHNIFSIFYTGNQKKGKNIVKYKEIINFYYALNWSYILSDLLKFLRANLRMLNFSESKVGKSIELAMSISAYAGLCMAIPLFKRSLFYHEKGLKLKIEIKDEYGIAQSFQFLGFNYEWKGDYNKAVEYFKQGAEKFNRIGDRKEYSTTLLGIVTSNVSLSNYTEAENVLKDHMELATKLRDTYAIAVNYYDTAKLYFERGLFPEAEKAANRSYDESYANKIWFVHCCSCTVLGEIFMEREDYKQAVYYLEKAKELHLTHRFLSHYVIFLYNLIAESFIIEFHARKSFSIKQDRFYLDKIKRACKDALKQTKPWQSHYGSALLVTAKYYSIIGKEKIAGKYFLSSIKHNEQVNRRYELARSLYYYGLFLRGISLEKEGEQKIRTAYRIFSEIKSDFYLHKTASALGIDPLDRASINVRFMNKQRFSSIIEVSQNIGSILTMDELISRVMQKSVEITGAQRGCLFLMDDETGVLHVEAHNNMSESDITEAVISLVNQVYNSESSLIEKGKSGETSSVLCVPLRSKNKIIGICYLENKLSNEVFSDEDKEVLEVIMIQAAISIVNARLYELATLDGLTKLFIQRHFLFLIEKEIGLINRYNRSCSLIMMDIDFFKVFNDRYGHQTGDEVLRAVGRIIKANCRNTDIPARYGGEEFALILPETDREMALGVGEKIRQAIEDYEFVHEGKNLKITMSMGIAESPYHSNKKDELIKYADKALYASKKNGRNCITIYTPS